MSNEEKQKYESYEEVFKNAFRNTVSRAGEILRQNLRHEWRSQGIQFFEPQLVQSTDAEGNISYTWKANPMLFSTQKQIQRPEAPPDWQQLGF